MGLGRESAEACQHAWRVSPDYYGMQSRDCEYEWEYEHEHEYEHDYESEPRFELLAASHPTQRSWDPLLQCEGLMSRPTCAVYYI